jgi:hypothetical protein
MSFWRRPALLGAAAAVSLALAPRIEAAAALLVALAGVLAATAALAMRKPAPEPLGAAQIVFGTGFLAGIYCHLFLAAPVPPQRVAGFRGLAVMALVFAASYACLHLRASLQKARFLGALAVFAVMGLAVTSSWMVVAALLAAWAVARIGAGQTGEVAALFLLFQPATFFVLSGAPPLWKYSWLGTALLCAGAAALSNDSANDTASDW